MLQARKARRPQVFKVREEPTQLLLGPPQWWCGPLAGRQTPGPPPTPPHCPWILLLEPSEARSDEGLVEDRHDVCEAAAKPRDRGSDQHGFRHEGVCGVAVGYPLDTVKVKIQTEPKYRGIWHCVWDTYRRERVWGFYRGLSLPVCTVSLVSSVSFGTYRHCLAHICRFRYGSTDIKPAKTDITLSGFASGLVRVFLTSPTEVAKVRLQTQTQQRRPSASWPSAAPPACPAPPASSGPGPKYRGPLHCLATVAREEGLRGLYKGSSALLFRDGHSFATYFLSYTILCEQLTPTGRSQPDVLGVLVAGGCAGVLAWAVATPMDVIKSRLQADGQGQRRYRGLLHCVVSSVREEGPRVLFKGLTLNCCRAFPVNMVVFVTYEAVLGLTRGLST
ncbi:solute carrier family 25 member 47 isoform X1 [Leopardus geoffroyi]|uniref:solute carrier family 25 member 47 isoform X1 n=1 Tax=Leopardus geoffroyi TaxID=46844 RepID=UPI001E260844|nr:solute carrier family 25 member 47 isoform X1 [Leopardus geoffroyi]